MPDPATTVGLSAVAAYVSKDLLTRLLGPTADYIGGGMQQFTQRRAESIGRIIQNGIEKAGDDLKGDKAVPPRVLRDIVNDGSFQDDDFAVEYFGGVLASSRTGVSRDDRAASYSSTVTRLSAYHIRAHYLFYLLFKRVFEGSSMNMLITTERKCLALFLSDLTFIKGMGLTRMS